MKRACAAAAVAVLMATLAGAATWPPGLRFETLSGPAADIHYPLPLAALASETYAIAHELLAEYERSYDVDLPRVHVVLADTDDTPNGFATPLPYPIVQIRAAAPDGAGELGSHDGWLRFVLTHELAHVVHLEQARGIWRLGRRIFGRAPFLFPNLSSPGWMIEGLATLEETSRTRYGRGDDADTEMVLRMAALADRFPSIDGAVATRDAWPAGNTQYLFGEAFLRDLQDRRDAPSALLPALARSHAGRFPPWLDEVTSKRVNGAGFSRLWDEWRARRHRDALDAVEARVHEGLTETHPLTDRGVRQLGPRFSPDGRHVAYTNYSFDRYGEVRVVATDGSGDHHVAFRNGGRRVAWTPDGHGLIYDEPDYHNVYESLHDLRRLDLDTGAVTRLTRGRRASDPDIAPAGATLVYVGRLPDRSELFACPADTCTESHALTTSPPGTEWHGPRFSPSGGAIAAGRLTPEGRREIATVDPATGTITVWISDGAKNVEPTWVDDERIVFRSDRDGVSNLYVATRYGVARRLTNVLGGAFTPDVSPDRGSIAFSDYGASGYDVRLAVWSESESVEAVPWSTTPASADTDFRPISDPRRYRPLPTTLPRFWSPYLVRGDNETQWGAVTAGADPLFRHVYALDMRYGDGSDRWSGRAVYRYDRWRPVLTFAAEDDSDLGSAGLHRTQTASLRVEYPVARWFRHSESLRLTFRRKREAGFLEDRPFTVDLGAVELAAAHSSVRRFPFSVSPVEGIAATVALLVEAPELGSDFSFRKLFGEAKGYRRLFAANDALAWKLGAGTTFGEPGLLAPFAIGGFADNSVFDPVATNLSVLRGYDDDFAGGRHLLHGNLEYRFPLGHPQRGWRVLPFFVRHVHAAVFVDAASAWSGRVSDARLYTSAGAAFGLDLTVFQNLPLTLTAGVAHGFAREGSTRGYFRVGLPF